MIEPRCRWLFRAMLTGVTLISAGIACAAESATPQLKTTPAHLTYLLAAFLVLVGTMGIYICHISRRLRQSTTKYRILTETMVDVVWTLDTDTLRFSYVSPSVQKLRGYTPAEVMAGTLEEALAPQHRREVCALIAQRASDLRAGKLESNNAFVNELEQPQKEGGSVWTEVVTRYFIDPQSGQVEIHGVTRDISERRKNETALALTLKHLERAESEERQLLSMASHEFRTPAAMIKASLDSLSILKDRIPPEVAQRLKNIGLASQRLTKLANNLISNDRLQELVLTHQKRSVELNQLVQEVVSKYPTEDALRVQLPEYPVLLNADATLLDIALHNLIDNALRYHATPNTPICISLEKCSDATGQWVEFRVADQGPGIADDEKEKIFQRFYSAKGGVNDGLGLSIVHFVARAHNGTATVIDNTPCGSAFVIKLPETNLSQPH